MSHSNAFLTTVKYNYKFQEKKYKYLKKLMYCLYGIEPVGKFKTHKTDGENFIDNFPNNNVEAIEVLKLVN